MHYTLYYTTQNVVMTQARLVLQLFSKQIDQIAENFQKDAFQLSNDEIRKELHCMQMLFHPFLQILLFDWPGISPQYLLRQ